MYDPLEGLSLLSAGLAWLCVGISIASLVRLLLRRAGETPDSAHRTMRTAAMASVVLWVVPKLVGIAAGAVGDGFDPVWNDPEWRVELAGAVSTLVLASSLVVARREPWALPPGRRRLGNWSVSGPSEDGPRR